MRKLLVVLLATIMFYGCDKSDSSTLFGNTFIYIPQSTVSGSTSIEYLVPTGADNNIYNFKVDTAHNVVNVFLGVTRSGLEANEAYTVNVGVRSDTINALIGNGLIDPTPAIPPVPVVLLPATAYTLPATVSVPAGKKDASFYLAINLATLKTYAGKKVALCVAITNPTKFTLSPTNNQVIILINVDALKLP